jgi:hypothetical protein
MKRTLAVLALLIGLGGGALSAQTRVSVSLSFGAPFVVYHPQPYHSHRYHSYRVYDPRPTFIVVRPMVIQRAPRILVRRQPVVVLRHRSRRHHHRW